MKNDWALAYFAYPLSRSLFPMLTFGRVKVAPWDERVSAPWRVKHTGRTQIELGPELAGLLTCVIVAFECLSLWTMGSVLHTLAR